MKVSEKIIACEKAYAECISLREEIPGAARFRDSLIPDMYDYNFTYVYEGISNVDLLKLISSEMEHSRSEGADFCKFCMDFPVSEELKLPEGMEKGIVGYYVFDIQHLDGLKLSDEVVIRTVNNPQRGNDVYKIDQQMSAGKLSEDFIRRSAKRRTSIYTSDGPINCFVCYLGEEPIGSCDLMIKNGTAKIEEFCVVPSMQRKGYGTAILRELIDRADICGADTIYLCTDEDDTPKDMYTKVGFTKVGERTELFIKL